MKYLAREEFIEYIQYCDMKCAKEKMEPLEKCKVIRSRDCKFVQKYMYQKSLEQSRLEFLWDTSMVDTRTTMKGKYEKNKYSCPHCREGREEGALETPDHILTTCRAYSDLREGLNPEAVLEDRASVLRSVIKRRKELEIKLKTVSN